MKGEERVGKVIKNGRREGERKEKEEKVREREIEVHVDGMKEGEEEV